MPRRAKVDHDAIGVLLAPGRSVATHRELRSLGLPASTISHRSGPDGPWQRLLPGVVAGHRGTPTAHERRLAAVKYGGAGAVLTGLDALELLGMSLKGVRRDGRVHVLIPHTSQRLSHGFALVTRTKSPGDATVHRGLPCVGAARAVTDAARRLDGVDEVRTLVARAVQQRHCTIGALAAELRTAARQRTALLRKVLREVQAGVRSEAEAKVRLIFRAHGVPEPRWNAPVRRPDGDLLAVVDGLWEEERVVLEIDSVEWHLEPADWRATQARHRLLVLAGMTVLAVAPGEVFQRPELLCQQVEEALVMARRARARSSLDPAAPPTR